MASSNAPSSDTARPEPARSPGAGRRLRVWSSVAVLVLLAGTIGSIFVANSVASKTSDQSRREFALATGDVASTLQLTIQHETI
jgi:CHASE1-domain containing sensor protein